MKEGWVIIVWAINVSKCKCCVVDRCVYDDKSSIWIRYGCVKDKLNILIYSN